MKDEQCHSWQCRDRGNIPPRRPALSGAGLSERGGGEVTHCRYRWPKSTTVARFGAPATSPVRESSGLIAVNHVGRGSGEAEDLRPGKARCVNGSNLRVARPVEPDQRLGRRKAV